MDIAIPDIGYVAMIRLEFKELSNLYLIIKQF